MKLRVRTIRALALCYVLIIGLVLLPSANALNQGWLVPSGHIKLDRGVINSGIKICALTFDDGPDTSYTPQVLETLHRYGIPATFFVIGYKARAYPEQVYRMLADGHEVGNHSLNHPDLTTLSSAGQRRQLADTNEILRTLGVEPRWFRPPYGAYNGHTVAVASELGLETILWSTDPRDWTSPGEDTIRNRVLSQTGPGGVILLHSIKRQTADMLPGLLDSLLARRYTFVTLTEWQQIITGEASLEELAALRKIDENMSGISDPLQREHSFYTPFSVTSDGDPGEDGNGDTVETEEIEQDALNIYYNFPSYEELNKVFELGGLTRLLSLNIPAMIVPTDPTEQVTSTSATPDEIGQPEEGDWHTVEAPQELTEPEYITHHRVLLTAGQPAVFASAPYPLPELVILAEGMDERLVQALEPWCTTIAGTTPAAEIELPVWQPRTAPPEENTFTLGVDELSHLLELRRNGYQQIFIEAAADTNYQSGTVNNTLELLKLLDGLHYASSEQWREILGLPASLICARFFASDREFAVLYAPATQQVTITCPPQLAGLRRVVIPPGTAVEPPLQTGERFSAGQVVHCFEFESDVAGPEDTEDG